MIKTKMFNSREFKIKLIIISSLLMMLVLSFFFVSEIESVLNLKSTYAKFQVSERDIDECDYKVSYLDVGQGNCTVIKLPDGKCAVIDGGNIMYGDKIVDELKELGVKSVDYLIASHADADHIGGLLKVLEVYEVKNIFRSFQIAGTGDNADSFIPNEFEDLAEVYNYYQEKTNNRSKISRVTSSVYSDFVKAIYTETFYENGNKQQSTVTVFYDGLKINGANYAFEFFAPLVREDSVSLSLNSENTEGYATVGYGSTDSNNNSAIVLFSCYGETFLFTGDASWTSGDKNAENQSFLESDFVNSLTTIERDKFANISVFIAGHHGSKYSSGDLLLSLINPEYVVVSVKNKNNYGHPHSEVIDRIKNTNNLAENYLLMTKDHGTITFSSKNGILIYSLSNFEESEKLTISWFELSTIIFIAVGYVVVLFKPKTRD